MYKLSDKSTEIIGQVLEFLDNDHPDSDINCYLEDEFEAMEKEANYIGKTDINGKKIYADCSIVEFDHFAANEADLQTNRAYLIYDINDCCYDLYFIDADLYGLRVAISHFSRSMRSEFKIIDTVQENKLGLIKCTMN